MIRANLFLKFAMILLVCCSLSRSLASPITVSYYGTITLSQAPGITVGSPFTGTFTYDNALQPSGPVGQATDFVQTGGGLTFSVDGFDFAVASSNWSELEVYVNDAQGHDLFGANSQYFAGEYTTDYQALPVIQMGNTFVWNAGALQMGMVPDPFDASNVLFGTFGNVTGAGLVFGTFQNPLFVSGLINSVEVVTTPEPKLVVLDLMFGFCLILRWLSKDRCPRQQNNG